VELFKVVSGVVIVVGPPSNVGCALVTLDPSHPHSKCSLPLRSERQLRFEWGWDGVPHSLRSVLSRPKGQACPPILAADPPGG